MVEKYPDRVAAVEWARSVGGGRRLVGGDWIFTDQQLDRLHSDYDALSAQLASAQARLQEATDLLGFAEARLLAFGQHYSSNSDYVLAMDAIRLFLMQQDAAIDAAREQEDKP